MRVCLHLHAYLHNMPMTTSPPGLGMYYPGAPVQARAYDPVSSSFSVNGSSTTGAQLVHVASGMCLTAGGNTAGVGEQLNLQKCKPPSALPVGVYTSTQLFSASSGGALITSQGHCVTAQVNANMCLYG